MHFETQVNAGLQGTTNANLVNDIQTKYRSHRTKDNIFLKPKDDRTYGERRPFLEADRVADLGRRKQDGEATVQLGAISPRKAKKCNRGWKEATRS